MINFHFGKRFKIMATPNNWTSAVKPRVQPKFKTNWYGRCTRSCLKF